MFEPPYSVIGPSVDPITRRLFVRSEIADREHLLKAGMFGDPIRALAVSQAAVIREGDGTTICWLTQDFRRFVRRIVVIGQRQGDLVQIVSGLEAGETVVSEEAAFLSSQAANKASH